MVRAVPEKNSPKKSRPKVTNGFKNDEVLTQNCSTSSSASDEVNNLLLQHEFIFVLKQVYLLFSLIKIKLRIKLIINNNYF